MQGMRLYLKEVEFHCREEAMGGYREWWGRMTWDARQGSRDTAGQSTAELM